jgi:hypothetical protein
MNPVPLFALLVGFLSLGTLGCSGSAATNGSDDRGSPLISALPTSLSATVTLLDDTPFGISVCATGSGLPPGSPVYLSYSNVPGLAPFTEGTSVGAVDQDGAYSVSDMSLALRGHCTAAQLAGDVTVHVSTSPDASTSQSTYSDDDRAFATATLPAALWCSNGSGAIDFNGGCR